MANICSCCGEKIPFFDISYDYIDVGSESYKICEKCRNKNDPLYDDIHQIAGDLRFIKNLIILGIVCSVLLGILGVLGIR